MEKVEIHLDLPLLAQMYQQNQVTYPSPHTEQIIVLQSPYLLGVPSSRVSSHE